jgi:flagellar biosynthesis GTPase FlhF
MSTTASRPAARTYRGRTLEEIVPRIREELGPDALIVRKRDGLTGGVAGFFQKRCIEIEALPGASAPAAAAAATSAPGARRIDTYDEAPDDDFAAGPDRGADPDLGAGFEPLDVADLAAAVPELRDDAATREGIASPALRTLIDQAQPFAEALDRAARAGGAQAPAPSASAPAAPAAVAPPAAEPPVSPREAVARAAAAAPALAAANPAPPEAAAIERELAGAGLDPALAQMLVAEAVSHIAPLARPGTLRDVVRRSLARRIRTMPGWSGQGRALAFVGAAGSGKTACAARLARAYAAGSDLPALCLALAPRDGGSALAAALEGSGVPYAIAATPAELRERVEAARSRAAVIVDTPAVSVADRAGIARLAAELRGVGLYELHLTLPATLSAHAAREQVAALRSLGASRLALTHAGETAHPGPAIGVAIAGGHPISFVAAAPSLLEAADPDELARDFLP